MQSNKPDDSPKKPSGDSRDPKDHDLAINLIRNKVNSLYDQEPDALKEEAEAEQSVSRSKHQQFIYNLTHSGKDLVQIQTDWHNYYQNLSDQEKREVWQEFFDSNQLATQQKPKPQVTTLEQQAQALAEHVRERAVPKPKTKRRSTQTIKKEIIAKAQAPPKLTWKHHVQSLLFGLSLGAVVVFILLFGFFNEVFIAPFIQPSRHDTATPIILSTDTVAPSSTPEVIIPKINVEIPVDYAETSTDESVIESDLNSGVVHYPTTSFPGETGNTAFFGHSSNNIFNPGKYKFAFVLLHELTQGDVFYLTYNNKIYAYKVFSTAIVSPNDVGVLDSVQSHLATATLITCDPPGTSINRLVVVGDQISPSPTGDSAPIQQTSATTQVNSLPGNGPTLWHRFISNVFGKIFAGLFILAAIWLIWRWLTKEFRPH